MQVVQRGQGPETPNAPKLGDLSAAGRNGWIRSISLIKSGPVVMLHCWERTIYTASLWIT